MKGTYGCFDRILVLIILIDRDACRLETFDTFKRGLLEVVVVHEFEHLALLLKASSSNNHLYEVSVRAGQVAGSCGRVDPTDRTEGTHISKLREPCFQSRHHLLIIDALTLHVGDGTVHVVGPEGGQPRG